MMLKRIIGFFRLIQDQRELLVAIDFLADVHTRDDHQVGFCVQMGAMPDDMFHSHHQYIEAWKIVRKYTHRQIEVTPESQAPASQESD